MNVTSLELSEELYQLSGWVDVRHSCSKSHPEADVLHPGGHSEGYTLGYLLRKLPRTREINGHKYRFALAASGDQDWTARYEQVDSLVSAIHHLNIAGSVEDVAAKLAVELFKQGVLTRGAS